MCLIMKNQVNEVWFCTVCCFPHRREKEGNEVFPSIFEKKNKNSDPEYTTHYRIQQGDAHSSYSAN